MAERRVKRGNNDVSVMIIMLVIIMIVIIIIIIIIIIIMIMIIIMITIPACPSLFINAYKNLQVDSDNVFHHNLKDFFFF